MHHSPLPYLITLSILASIVTNTLIVPSSELISAPSPPPSSSPSALQKLQLAASNVARASPNSGGRSGEPRRPNQVKGEDNRVRGWGNDVNGNRNDLIGVDNQIQGSTNQVTGRDNYIVGNGNIILSNTQQPSSVVQNRITNNQQLTSQQPSIEIAGNPQATSNQLSALQKLTQQPPITLALQPSPTLTMQPSNSQTKQTTSQQTTSQQITVPNAQIQQIQSQPDQVQSLPIQQIQNIQNNIQIASDSSTLSVPVLNLSSSSEEQQKTFIKNEGVTGGLKLLTVNNQQGFIGTLAQPSNTQFNQQSIQQTNRKSVKQLNGLNMQQINGQNMLQLATVAPQRIDTVIPQNAVTASPQSVVTASPQSAVTASPQSAVTASPQSAVTFIPQSAVTFIPQSAVTITADQAQMFSAINGRSSLSMPISSTATVPDLSASKSNIQVQTPSATAASLSSQPSMTIGDAIKISGLTLNAPIVSLPLSTTSNISIPPNSALTVTTASTTSTIIPPSSSSLTNTVISSGSTSRAEANQSRGQETPRINTPDANTNADSSSLGQMQRMFSRLQSDMAVYQRNRMMNRLGLGSTTNFENIRRIRSSPTRWNTQRFSP